MTRLEELLEGAAAERAIGFEVDDVRDRVRRRRRARRVVAASVVLVVLAGVAGVAASMLGGDDRPERVDVAEGGSHEVAGVDLIGRWALGGVSEVMVLDGEGTYLEFDADGTLHGDDGCDPFTTTWGTRGGRLIVGPGFESNGPGCSPGIRLRELLTAEPRIGTFDNQADTLELRTDERFVFFVRDVADDDRPDVDDGTDGDPEPTSTTAPEPADTETGPPAQIVAVREDGWLVTIDRATGEQRELYFGGDPFDEGGPAFIDGVEMSPAGMWIYFSTCCAPAPGRTYRIPIDGGEPEHLADMAYPAISPDGRYLAGGAGRYLAVATEAPEADADRSAGPPPAAASVVTLELDAFVRQIAWSADGTELLVETTAGPAGAPQVRLFHFDGETLVERDTGKPENPGEFPTWDILGMPHIHASGDPGTVLRDRIRSISRDQSNRWILTVDAEGRTTFRTDEGAPQPLADLPPLFLADW